MDDAKRDTGEDAATPSRMLTGWWQQAGRPTALVSNMGRLPVELAIARSDLDGAPRSGAGSWKLYRLRQPRKALLPADQPLAKWRIFQPRERGLEYSVDHVDDRFVIRTNLAALRRTWDEVPGGT